MPSREKLNEYDAEPVEYCSRCYSLRIKYEEAIDSDCCMDCGCSDTKTLPIGEWEKLYEKRYGHKFIQKKVDPIKNLIFKMGEPELKAVLWMSDSWHDIIYRIYPKFPGGLNKSESLVLFFDKLKRDRKTDELKKILLTIKK